MKSILTVMCMAVIFAACYNKQSATPAELTANNCLHATVWDINNADCGFPVLSFAGDSAFIQSITGQKGVLHVAKYLPPAFNTKGRKLCVAVAALKPEEDFYCTMMGITYPHIKVISVKDEE